MELNLQSGIKNGMPPIHPGIILKKIYLEPMGMTGSAFATHIGVSRSYISNIISGRRDITVELAMKMAKALNTTVEIWLKLQLTYDIRVIETTNPNLTDNIKKIEDESI